MSLPLPECPAYRKLVVTFWLEDIDDRLKANRVEDAEKAGRLPTRFTYHFHPATETQISKTGYSHNG